MELNKCKIGKLDYCLKAVLSKNQNYTKFLNTNPNAKKNQILANNFKF